VMVLWLMYDLCVWLGGIIDFELACLLDEKVGMLLVLCVM